jgi:hypothetical protein
VTQQFQAIKANPLKFLSLSVSSNTQCKVDTGEFFRVTHPFHPLYGRKFALIARRHNWGLDQVYYYDNEKKLKSLPVAWTDAIPPDPVVALSAGRSAFRIQDLLELSRMMEAVRAKNEGK